MKCSWISLCARPLQQTIIILGVWIVLNTLIFSKRDGKISVLSEGDKIQQPNWLHYNVKKTIQSTQDRKDNVLGQLAIDLPNLPIIHLLENKGPDSVLTLK